MKILNRSDLKIANGRSILRLDGALTERDGVRFATRLSDLLAQEVGPITVILRSDGGEVRAFLEAKKRLASDGIKDFCRVQTIAIVAESTAAFFLVASEYAYTLRDVRLRFHGTHWRSREQVALDREQAFAIGVRLDRANRAIAWNLAGRILHRILSLHREIDAGTLFASRTNPIAGVENIVAGLSKNLKSKCSVLLLNDAVARFRRVYTALDQAGFVATADCRSIADSTMYRAMIDLSTDEVGCVRPIDPIIATQISIDYALTRDLARRITAELYPGNVEHGAHRRATDGRKYDGLRLLDLLDPGLDRLSLTISEAISLWCFTTILCHRLLSGQSSLSAPDAYWLGLIDGMIDCPEDEFGGIP